MVLSFNEVSIYWRTSLQLYEITFYIFLLYYIMPSHADTFVIYIHNIYGKLNPTFCSSCWIYNSF